MELSVYILGLVILGIIVLCIICRKCEECEWFENKREKAEDIYRNTIDLLANGENYTTMKKRVNYIDPVIYTDIRELYKNNKFTVNDIQTVI